MNNELKEVFNKAVEEMKNKSLEEKQQMTIQGLKEFLAVTYKIAADLNISYTDLLNREILDVNNSSVTQEDFIEAVYVYLESIKEVFSSITTELLGKMAMEMRGE